MKYTLLIFAVCALVFVAQNSNPQLTETLVLSSSSAFNSFTYMFAHANLFHFMLNMLVLFAFGPVVEDMFHSRMLFIFMVSGIVSGLFSLLFYEAVIGASGAIYGLIGAAAMLRPGKETWLGIIGIPTPLIIVAAVYAISDIIGIFFYTGTANAAHLVGLAVGILFAMKNRELAAPV